MREDLPRGAGPLRPRVDHLLRWGPPIVWMGVIFVLSSDLASEAHTGEFALPILRLLFPGLSPESYASLHDLIRKLGHLTEYAVLAVLWARTLAGPRARWRMRHIAGSLIIAVLWAMGDEWHQAFVPSRSASMLDVGIDAIGAVLGVAIGRVLRGIGKSYGGSGRAASPHHVAGPAP